MNIETLKISTLSLAIATSLLGCVTNQNLPSKNENTPISIQQIKTNDSATKPDEFVFCDDKGAWKCKKKTKLVKLTNEEVDRQKRDFKLEKSTGTQDSFMDGYHSKKNDVKKSSTPQHTINFQFDKDALLESAKNKLAQIILQSKSKEVTFILQGYTDNIGTENYNDDLAKRRARNVQHYLIDNGIDSNKIVINGEGKCCYIGINTTENGRAKNRRVEIYLN